MADLGLSREVTPQSVPRSEGNTMDVWRNVFLVKEGTGPERSKISEKVLAEYSVFMTDYITNLYRLYHESPQVLRKPGHEHELDLIQQFDEPDNDQRALKVRNFVRTNNGLKLTTLALEQQASKKLSILGLIATSNKPGERDDVVKSSTTRMDEDQGGINKLWHNTFAPRKEKIVGMATAIGVGSAKGLHTGSTYGAREALVGAVIGGVSGAGIATGAYEMVRGLRPGTTIKLEEAIEELNRLKSNPDEARYLKEMYKIDVNSFDTTTGKITPLPDRDLQHVSRLKEEAEQHLKARRDFYIDLGVPKKRIDMFPEEFLYKYDKRRGPEQIDSLMQAKIFKKLERDIVYNDPNATPAKKQERMRKARAAVMSELTAELIKDERSAESVTKSRPVTELKLKQTEYSGEAIKNKKNAEYIKKSSDLSTERDKLNKKLELFTGDEDGNEGIDSLIKSLKATADKLNQPPYNLGITQNSSRIEVAGKAAALRAAIEKTINDSSSTPPGLNDQLREQESNRSNDIRSDVLTQQAAIRATLGPKDSISPKMQDQILDAAQKAADVKYKGKIEELKKKIEGLNKSITDLQELENAFRTVSEKLAEEESKIKSSADKELVATTKAYDKLRVLPGGVTATITDAMLEGDSVDKIITLATAPPYSIPNGTPDEQASLRKLIIQAKTEYKAREKEKLEPSPTVNIDAFNVITASPRPITPDDLLSRSDAELVYILEHDSAYSGIFHGVIGPVDTRGSLSRAKEEALKRLRNRYRISLEEAVKDKDDQIEELKEKMEKVGNFEAEQALIDSAVSFTDDGRQESIFKGAERVIKEDSSKFLSQQLYRLPDDESILSESERSLIATAPKGYYEFMNLLFDYRSKSDRNEYFKKISTALPPEKLALLLSSSLDLTPTKNINSALLGMRNKVKSSHLSGSDMRHAFGNIIDRLREEALALP